MDNRTQVDETQELTDALYRPSFENDIWMCWQLGENDPFEFFENKYQKATHVAMNADTRKLIKQGEIEIVIPKGVKIMILNGIASGNLWIC